MRTMYDNSFSLAVLSDFEHPGLSSIIIVGKTCKKIVVHSSHWIRIDDNPIQTLELPRGMVMDERSYEVLCRYVLADVVNS